MRKTFLSSLTLSLVPAFAAVFALGFGLTTTAAAASELNIYSSRHYDSDDALYRLFEAETGIRVNRLEDEAAVLIQRILNEGEHSPADILITVDAGRLHLADREGLFAPLNSAILNERIPAHLRHPDGHWFGFSKRARLIYYNKELFDPAGLESYEDLARPEYKGKVCTRSSSNVYMLSLLASQIAHLGEEAAKSWVEGLWANRARDPEGGDTDQLRALVSGQCQIAVANSYYFARALRTEVKGLKHPEETSLVGVIFPSQAGTGTHVNISGAGLLRHAPNRENAVRFLEFLTTAAAQQHFADANDEYPVVAGVALASSLDTLRGFQEDTLPLTALGDHQARAQELYDAIGYK